MQLIVMHFLQLFLSQTLMDRRIKPWINKKIIEYIGEEEATLVDFVCSKVSEQVFERERDIPVWNEHVICSPRDNCVLRFLLIDYVGVEERVWSKVMVVGEPVSAAVIMGICCSLITWSAVVFSLASCLFLSSGDGTWHAPGYSR